jgi:hypothetical protein
VEGRKGGGIDYSGKKGSKEVEERREEKRRKKRGGVGI